MQPPQAKAKLKKTLLAQAKTPLPRLNVMSRCKRKGLAYAKTSRQSTKFKPQGPMPLSINKLNGGHASGKRSHGMVSRGLP